MSPEDKKELVAAFRKAVDFEKRFGYRTDVPELYSNWDDLVELLVKAFGCQKKKPKA